MTIVAASYVNPVRPATVAFAAAAGSSTNPVTSYTFASQSLGTADPSRIMVVIVYGRNDTGSPNINVGTVDSVSVGGTGCTRRFTLQNASRHWTAWTCAKPTGSTGSVVIARGDGFTYAYFVMFAAYDLLSAAATDSAANLNNVPTDNPCSLTNTITFGGIIVAMAADETGGGTGFTWLAPADEVCDLNVGVASASRISGALISKQQNAGTRTANFITRSTTGAAHHQCALAFR